MIALSCGELSPVWCFADGMTSFLHNQKILIFDYATKLANPLREEIRANAERLAAENGVEIEFIRKIKEFRKEDRIKAILAQRGSHPGLVHIFSAMETCNSYKPWHDKPSGKNSLINDSGKCLHYYFYFIDPLLGLVLFACPYLVSFPTSVLF